MKCVEADGAVFAECTQCIEMSNPVSFNPLNSHVVYFSILYSLKFINCPSETVITILRAFPD